MLSEIDCPFGASNEGCDGPVTFEIAGTRPELPLCREDVRKKLEDNPNYFAGLMPVDLSVVEEDVVIDIRIKGAVSDAVKDLRGSAVVGSTGPRLVYSR